MPICCRSTPLSVRRRIRDRTTLRAREHASGVVYHGHPQRRYEIKDFKTRARGVQSMIKDPENAGLLNQLLELRAENEYLARLSDVEVQEFVGDLEEVACAEGDTLIELGETVDELDVLRDLESEVEIITLAGGETLFGHGDPGDSAYIVMSGRLRVVLDLEAGEECTLNELGRGEVLGEMALLTGDSRSATV